jgi:U3 small nucleolar RNA-associated protein 7
MGKDRKLEAALE